MRLEKIGNIKANPNNPRIIKDDKFKKLVKSIKEFPEMLNIRPIVVDSEMMVLGGNQRLKACIEAGLKEVSIIVADAFSEDQKKEFIVKDNIGYGEWDFDLLKVDYDVIVLEDWGLDLPEIGEEELVLEAEEDDFDATPPEEPITVLGDLYEIGEHRLLCGDSTCSDTVGKLMNGEKADMVFTDPPYDLENEDYHSIIPLFTKDAHVFVMHDDKGIVNYLRLSKLDFSRFYVANFGFSSPRGNDPYLSHILISQEKNGNAIPHKNMHDGFRSIIPMEYRFRLKDDKTEHKHQKPIKFVSNFIEHFSNTNSLVFDLFLGSGTTMVASHQLKRKCYGLELDPKYCDVIVRRMIKLDDTLTVKRNGIDCTNEFK